MKRLLLGVLAAVPAALVAGASLASRRERTVTLHARPDRDGGLTTGRRRIRFSELRKGDHFTMSDDGPHRIHVAGSDPYLDAHGEWEILCEDPRDRGRVCIRSSRAPSRR